MGYSYTYNVLLKLLFSVLTVVCTNHVTNPVCNHFVFMMLRIIVNIPLILKKQLYTVIK